MPPALRTIRPKLKVLPEAQRALWTDLDCVPRTFRLAGGTGLALLLGHRTSIDFDFFAFDEIDPKGLLDTLPVLTKARVVALAPNTLTVSVGRRRDVKVSFFGVPRLKPVAPPLGVAGSAVQVSNPIEIAAFKAAVLPQRVEVKDYLDVIAILRKTDIALVDMLAAAHKLYGEQFNPFMTLQALADLDSGEIGRLRASDKRLLREAIAGIDPLSLFTAMQKANIKSR